MNPLLRNDFRNLRHGQPITFTETSRRFSLPGTVARQILAACNRRAVTEPTAERAGL
jgi:hypothetical protein